MRKISDYRDEEALDLLADLLEPATEILADEVVQQAAKGQSKIKVASVIIKNHKQAIMQILAALDGVSIEDFHCNVFTLPARVIELLNDKELLSFFGEQVQMVSTAVASGPATEPTGETEVEKA